MRTVAVIFTDRRIPLSEVSLYKKYKFLCNYDIISPLDIIEDPRYTTKMMVIGFNIDYNIALGVADRIFIDHCTLSERSVG